MTVCRGVPRLRLPCLEAGKWSYEESRQEGAVWSMARFEIPLCAEALIKPSPTIYNPKRWAWIPLYKCRRSSQPTPQAWLPSGALSAEVSLTLRQAQCTQQGSWSAGTVLLKVGSISLLGKTRRAAGRVLVSTTT